MRFVTDKLEILVIEFEYGSARIDFHAGKLLRLARELQSGLLDVIEVKMRVSESVNEFSGLKTAHFGYHHRQQRVRGYIERHAEKDIGRPLIHLTRQFALCDIELEQQMTRRKRHSTKLAHIPRRDYKPPRIGIGFDLFYYLGYLIDRATV
jgi:hypothetical protein